MDDRMVIGIATLAAATGLWLLMPRRRRWGHRVGLAVSVVGLVLFASRLPILVSRVDAVVLAGLSALAISACVGTITSRDPVRSAIWFGLALLAVAGLFLFDGAQFLGVATVVVYAGAILVTFLFVLMLAQPEGRASYDRLSWVPIVTVPTGALLAGMLLLQISAAVAGVDTIPTVTPQKASPTTPVSRTHLATHDPSAEPSGGAIRTRPNPPNGTGNVLARDHTARLGAELFSRQLIAVELAGVLLLATLVGAVAIMEHHRNDPPAGGRSVEDGVEP
ncbi:MAG: NADH-quinone oxidoreductase subunit J [Pirellulales bacterium]